MLVEQDESADIDKHDTQPRTSAHKKSLQLIINQLQNQILRLQQIHISNKVWKWICYGVTGVTAVYKNVVTLGFGLAIVSTVSMSDILQTKVVMATNEMSLNGMTE